MADIPTADPEHLTAVLRHIGALGDASVRDVTGEKNQPTIVSRIVRLRAHFDGYSGDAPTSIILKTAHPERAAARGWEGGRNEVAFHRDVATAMPSGPVPRCFEAHADDARKSWHLLLEDLIGSHRIVASWPLPPSHAARAHCRGSCAVSCGVVGRRTPWWNDWRTPRCSDGRANDAGLRESLCSDGRSAWRWAVRGTAGALRAVSGATAPLIARCETRRDLTITHNDLHVWDCFMPRDGGNDVRLFDWDAWRLGVGASDLAYMMAVHWYPERRRRMERALLDQYHATLLECGVRGIRPLGAGR